MPGAMPVHTRGNRRGNDLDAPGLPGMKLNGTTAGAGNPEKPNGRTGAIESRGARPGLRRGPVRLTSATAGLGPRLAPLPHRKNRRPRAVNAWTHFSLISITRLPQAPDPRLPVAVAGTRRRPIRNNDNSAVRKCHRVTSGGLCGFRMLLAERRLTPLRSYRRKLVTVRIGRAAYRGVA